MRTARETVLSSADISLRRAELHEGKLRSAQLRSAVVLALPGVACTPVGRLRVAPVVHFAALPRAGVTYTGVLGCAVWPPFLAWGRLTRTLRASEAAVPPVQPPGLRAAALSGHTDGPVGIDTRRGVLLFRVTGGAASGSARREISPRSQRKLKAGHDQRAVTARVVMLLRALAAPPAARALLVRPALLVRARLMSDDWQLKGSGLRVLQVSSGENTDEEDFPAKVGQTVRVEYRAWIDDGTLVASGTSSFKLGGGIVCQALDEGVPGMCLGDRRRLRAPPALRRGPALSSAPSGVVVEYDVRLTGIVQHMRIVTLEEPGSDDPLQMLWRFAERRLAWLLGGMSGGGQARKSRHRAGGGGRRGKG